MSTETVPRLIMVFAKSTEEAKSLATERGWTTHCIIPRTSEGEGCWLVKGVKSAKAMPKQYKALRLFPNEFTDQVTVTCGFGKEAHQWTTSRAEAKVFHRCPEHR